MQLEGEGIELASRFGRAARVVQHSLFSVGLDPNLYKYHRISLKDQMPPFACLQEEIPSKLMGLQREDGGRSGGKNEPTAQPLMFSLIHRAGRTELVSGSNPTSLFRCYSRS